MKNYMIKIGTKITKVILLDNLCLYGSLSKPGWTKVSIRRSNGMVVLTPTLNEKNPLIGLSFTFYVPEKVFKRKAMWETTFTFSLYRGFVGQFG